MAQNQAFFIALGANLPFSSGEPADTLRIALERLEEKGFQDLRVSRFYETPCFPAGAGPDYVNAAAKMSYEGSAQDVLVLLHEVEAEFGRERVQRWGQRTLDLDLIGAGADVVPDKETYHSWLDLPAEAQRSRAPDQLILPHPRLQDRAFVLVPLADIAPDWHHPVLGLSVIQMLENLDKTDIAEVKPI